jgi:metal-responsive CopG/Arc/MetJ family transcriptional regulator
MPNQPGADTVTVSFTLPKALSDAVNARAKREMTNKSDIIRRALLAYVGPTERAAILREAGIDYVAINNDPPARN